LWVFSRKIDVPHPLEASRDYWENFLAGADLDAFPLIPHDLAENLGILEHVSVSLTSTRLT
jgi:hypothetical protein